MFELNLQRAVLKDRYEVKGRISSGSYAEVFVARDRDSGNAVVIKALNSCLQGTPPPELEQMLDEKFHTEAVILNTVRHANIVTLLDQGESEDCSGHEFSFIALEFMAGGDLMEHKRTLQEQKLGLAETLYYFKQICDGLAYAHACGVIHRDLKPENLLLSADWRTIKIADFGVAKTNGAEYSPITRVGTPLYSAPEHSPSLTTEESGTLTASADIYALAKSCFTVLCGRVPSEFSGKPISGLGSSAAAQPWAHECLKVLKRATAHEVGHRYGSVTEFWSDLANLATFDPAVTRAIPFKRPSPEQSELAKKRAELAPIEAIRAQRELELVTLQAELRDFESRYLGIVGVRYTELDEIEAQIAEAIATLDPNDETARAQAEQARFQAQESAQATESVSSDKPSGECAPSDRLKRLRREAARLIHPDTVLDEGEKQRHHEWMAKVNKAFDDRDEVGLREILNQWESSPESVIGEGVAADLVRVIRKIALVEQRLKAIEEEMVSLEQSDLYLLRSKVHEAQAEGIDLLSEMAAEVGEQIDDAGQRLEEILRTRLSHNE
jgi:serine/threonine protein kinase